MQEHLELVIEAQCPYCGEAIQATADPANIGHTYVEDCATCCRPILFTLTMDDDGQPTLTAARENN